MRVDRLPRSMDFMRRFLENTATLTPGTILHVFLVIFSLLIKFYFHLKNHFISLNEYLFKLVRESFKLFSMDYLKACPKEIQI